MILCIMWLDVTACAVNKRIIRLRRMVAKEGGDSVKSTPPTSPSKSRTTPKKKVKGGGIVKTPTKIAKRNIKRESEMEDGDESDMSVQVVIHVKKEYKDEEVK
ncbi:hypothetical protein BDV36DRAFT_246130 [Aspergillus pseudocaelatus]|uniref:Uncharacterized protein n=1 Tax=Aspergillus pseudocaelatus TaxID=1825620 RepID=A0ABQ6WYN8_9EURO|nr:hypothetical protein BDV36DRAFT_246130 [Aspergillus pseudocaelatus]